jgi:cytochrome bd-type quinol oxidase subunit 2
MNILEFLCPPGSPAQIAGCKNANNFGSIGRLINFILPNVVVIAGVISFFIMLGAGWAVLSGAGKDQSAQDKAKAQAALTYSVIGFLLIVSAYFILNIVSQITGIKFWDLPNL